jgi:hypothetical protein
VVPGRHATPAEKSKLAAEIIVTYAVTRWQMPRGDIRDVAAASRTSLAETPHRLPLGTRETWELATHLGRAVDRTLRVLPTDSRCLVQSLVLSRLLSARGISSTLVIGAHSRPEFAAHAWVEHAGLPVLPHQGFHDSRLLEL